MFFYLSEVGQVRLGLHGDLLSGFRTAYVEVYLIFSSIGLQITIFYVSGVLNIWCAPIERNIFIYIRGLGFKSYSLFQAHVRLCAYLVREIPRPVLSSVTLARIYILARVTDDSTGLGISLSNKIGTKLEIDYMT